MKLQLPRPLVNGFWLAAGATVFAAVAGATIALAMPNNGR